MIRKTLCWLLLLQPGLGFAGLSLFDEEPVVELGSQPGGEVVKFELLIENPSSKPMEKLTFETACECTRVELEADRIEAGSSIVAMVSLDTLGQLRRAEKRIDASFLHDGKQHKKRIALKLIVRARIAAHEGRSLQDHLFEKSCARCHAQPAKGKHGAELFAAVCGQCHGVNAEGASAPGFNRLSYLRTLDPKVFRQVISDGIEDRQYMPGFSQQWGGPLSDEQIDSLVDYIVDKKKDWENTLQRRNLKQ